MDNVTRTSRITCVVSHKNVHSARTRTRKEQQQQAAASAARKRSATRLAGAAQSPLRLLREERGTPPQPLADGLPLCTFKDGRR